MCILYQLYKHPDVTYFYNIVIIFIYLIHQIKQSMKQKKSTKCLWLVEFVELSLVWLAPSLRLASFIEELHSSNYGVLCYGRHSAKPAGKPNPINHLSSSIVLSFFSFINLLFCNGNERKDWID